MILITGANGNLGRRLLQTLAGRHSVRAVVRSERAAATIDLAGVEVRIVDYLDQEAMTEAAVGCSHIVHLVGIIKESAASSFVTAHQGTTSVVLEAARLAGVRRIVYLSILGAELRSTNACLASKAAAEALLMEADVAALVLRVPMVLGEQDYASRALFKRARSRLNLQLRAASLEQPIFAGDVVAAILAVLPDESGGEGLFAAESLRLDLAGPESLSRRALTERAAEVLGRRTTVISVPFGLGSGAAWLFEKLMTNPPVSRAMLQVLDHDDHIDPSAAARRLGISLTSLNDALRVCLVESPPA